MPICGIIAPRQEDIVCYRADGYLAECILSQGHFCPHVIKTPEGKYFEWEDDSDCDCCSADEDNPCYVYQEITKEEADKLLGRGRK